MRLKYDPPLLIKKLFRSYNWNSSVNKILLTFDDGPTENTPEILRTLDQYSIKAVFFCVGQNLEKYPELAKEIVASGHTIGNHTYSHKILRKLVADEAHREIIQFNKIYARIFNESPEYFRPPHGKFSPGLQNQLAEFNLSNVMWSLLTYDYKNDLNIVKFAVYNYLRNNSIVVLHDNLKCADIILDSIHYVVKVAEERSYEFGEPAECLK